MSLKRGVPIMRRSAGLLVLALGVPGVAAADTVADQVSITIDSAVAIAIDTVTPVTFQVEAQPMPGGITYNVIDGDTTSTLTYSALTGNPVDITVDSDAFALDGMTLSVSASSGTGSGICGTGSSTNLPITAYAIIAGIDNGNGCSSTLTYDLMVNDHNAVDPGQSPLTVNLTYTLSGI